MRAVRERAVYSGLADALYAALVRHCCSGMAASEQMFGTASTVIGFKEFVEGARIYSIEKISNRHFCGCHRFFSNLYVYWLITDWRIDNQGEDVGGKFSYGMENSYSSVRNLCLV